MNIDHDSFRTEMLAYSRFRPDVVVDDFSAFSGFATALKRLPRVTMQRTGMFPGALPRNPNHNHSSDYDAQRVADVTALGLEQPKTFADLFNGDLKIVPGIRSIEVLPDHLRNDPTYYYCGPLITDDYLVPRASGDVRQATALNDYREFESLQSFFEANKGRKLVYASFGTVAKAGERMIGCIKDLLRKGIAVVTSLKLGENIEFGEGLYYQASYLPMHLVCSRADLMIHHCGSGTYHYPILHALPAVTIGTRCYDRDDVAVRLEELGISEHVPAPEEGEGFEERFSAAVESKLNASNEEKEEIGRRFKSLNEEIESTVRSFNFEHLLEEAMELNKCRSVESKQLSSRGVR